TARRDPSNYGRPASVAARRTPCGNSPGARQGRRTRSGPGAGMQGKPAGRCHVDEGLIQASYGSLIDPLVECFGAFLAFAISALCIDNHFTVLFAECAALRLRQDV